MVFVKIGGVVATDPTLTAALLADLGALGAQNPVLVHGGGKEVTAVSQVFGLQAVFRDGVRLTTEAEMDVVDMVLGGKINLGLVRQALRVGVRAVGLGGQDAGLFTGEARTFEGSGANRTGRITQVRPDLLVVLTQAGLLPIVHSTSCDASGQGLNINADEAAQELAVAVRAEALVYISDIDGVLKDGQVIPRLDEAGLEAEIASGVIGGGMVPKVRNARAAVAAGVGRVIIGGYRGPGDLAALLAGQAGTTIL